MAAEAHSLPQQDARPEPPKRRLRNFLLDARFQLKYTGMVVLVTAITGGVLGYFAYDFSVGQTEMMTIGWAMDGRAEQEIVEMARAHDRKVLLSIVAGIGILVVALGLTGIVVTHRVVGPAYKMKKLLQEVQQGHLRVSGRLRKGDELQDLFEAFSTMLASLRERQQAEVAQLDAALERARAEGVSSEALRDIERVRDRMRAELE
ncbi:MAG: hypothetical protein NZ898_03705 [Myxococcota bacterium]|nr:hypothetical protein [Myxococcota bacterium]MDW8361214.1 hypothetical protein [Myxococcales bacterium]